MLKTAYAAGAKLASGLSRAQHHELTGDFATPVNGLIAGTVGNLMAPGSGLVLGPLASGLTSSAYAPRGEKLRSGLMAGGGGFAGSVGGALGGAAAGGSTGALIGAIVQKLRGKNVDDGLRLGGGIGAAAGGIIGSKAGLTYGSMAGREYAKK